MTRYIVETFASPLGGSYVPSITMHLTVEADSEHKARQKAIDAAYRTGREIQHVRPHGKVRKVTP